MLIFPFSISFTYTKHEGCLRRLNSVLLHIVYAPLLIVFVLIFVVGNVFMMPFAYGYSIVHKMMIMCNDKKTGKCILLGEFAFFLAFGWLILLITQVTDIAYFVVHMYSTTNERMSQYENPQINVKSFKLMLQVVLQLI